MRYFKESNIKYVFIDMKESKKHINIASYSDKCKSRDCKTLKEYAEYVERVRKYVRNMELEEAVDQAITECIQEGILSEFLKKNRAEAKSVSIYEYDMEKHMRMERAEAREEGKREGMEKGLQEGRTKLLQEMVEKKSKKGQSAANIAQDLELTEEIVRDLLKKCSISAKVQE